MAKPGFWKKRWVVSYIFDYAIVVVLIGGFSAMDLMEPFHQRFSLTNESLQYPFADPERISPFWAGIISCFTPLLVIVVWTMLIDGQFSHHKPTTNRSRIMGGPWTMADRLWELNCGILGLGLSVAGAICITGALKNATGKPRPDIIARCLPREGSKNGEVFGLVTSDICTQTNHHVLKDGFRSWPSGHSSTAFAGLGYLSLFMAGKMHIMDNRGEVWKTVLVMVPLLGAALVAISRIMDARHHPFDVITGSMLGQFTAWVSYRQYFPPVTEPKYKGRAYSHRTWGADSTTAEAVDYEQAGYSMRGLEEGQAGSSDSLTNDPRNSRRRPTVMGRSTTFDSQTDDIEMNSRSRMGAPMMQQQYSDGGNIPLRREVSPQVPTHAITMVHPSQRDTNPFTTEARRESQYRGSVDMGDHRRDHRHDSPEPEDEYRLGRLSPPSKATQGHGQISEMRV